MNQSNYLNSLKCIIIAFLYFPSGIQSVCEYQHKGVAMVPKRALDVMSCEVNRLLQLSKNSIIPIPYVVPRKVRLLFAVLVVGILHCVHSKITVTATA